MNIKYCFSIVLYKTSMSTLYPLLSSLGNLASFLTDSSVSVVFYDNSPTSVLSDLLSADYPFDSVYKHDPRNLGFGFANNESFRLLFGETESFVDNKVFIVCNPDISFEPVEIVRLYRSFELFDAACVAPLILNASGSVQYSVKSNPTILSLLVSRFSLLQSFPIFSNYLYSCQNRFCSYRDDFLHAPYLSGCFLMCRPKSFSEVKGFNTSFFLHFEDADLVRRLEQTGLCIHAPSSQVIHRWARGSHYSLSQTYSLIVSMFHYFFVWGFQAF